ncbi:hypothetical protein T4E_4399 [Trichinella pseudospiralis]|uniref:Uncharacterized protein n=1 Tax=Trichinella pseudospiralis TaxID=6337 RepID=A0A0V0XSM3_TRIPS|nr:hypothetical protein T4E_4399 [Trichinella pseudospiralis]
MAWNQQIVYGRSTGTTQYFYLFFHFTIYVKFFWFSRTYKQLIQVFAEVQHDLWLYSHVCMLSSVR